MGYSEIPAVQPVGGAVSGSSRRTQLEQEERQLEQQLRRMAGDDKAAFEKPEDKKENSKLVEETGSSPAASKQLEPEQSGKPQSDTQAQADVQAAANQGAAAPAIAASGLLDVTA